ncbi:MAG: asparagine synthase (glutamine-hydrolyzing) [Bacteroidales bacterium]|nr:asparagine synthase (glutamine-hydrolyzing) [Bacteroidales bacterium]OQB56914.1 MAG: Asparagine synthetase (glutamine-hydrolyzing) 1 [Bacteroidetes bacterium ADurb.Bin145]
MCGIAGIIGLFPESSEVLDTMLKVQAHRGPDGTGHWADEYIALGHNRLSIIDLNHRADQPMISNCGRFIIVLNGEIYNYRELKEELHEYNFKTESDTEVVIAAWNKWGREMLHRLNGMFSLAIWDRQNKKLFAARDRFGVKPFYYSVSKGDFIFSSEIKTLWAAGMPREKNLSVLAKYLVYGSYGMPHETFWKNIHQLPAGYWLEVDVDHQLTPDEIKPVRWYDFVSRIKESGFLDSLSLNEKYFALLKESIRFRFRSDVPVGFNISGGLDSSALLAIINNEYPDNNSIEAFTFYTGHPDYDELPWVENLISFTGKPLNRVLLTSIDVPRLIEKVSYFQDEPFGGFPTLAYSLIFEYARQKGVIVLLDGQGMDEAWAGYDYYQNDSGYTVQGTKSSPVRPEVLETEFRQLADKDAYPAPFEDTLMNLQYRDLFYTKIPRALRFNDRASMMHSTELREPFLDHRLVELAFSQPRNIKIKNGISKWMLRNLVKHLLGSDIAFSPKRPLQTPQREWLAGDLRDYTESIIGLFAKNDFVIQSEVSKIWDSYLKGKNDNSFFIWQWINVTALS